MIERLVAHRNRALGKNWQQHRCDRGGKGSVALGPATAEIAMHKRGRCADTGEGGWHAIAKIAQYEVCGIGRASGIGREPAVERENFTVRKEGPQMIEGAAIAEPKLDDRSFDGGDQCGGVIEAVALRRDAAEKTIKPTHVDPFMSD